MAEKPYIHVVIALIIKNNQILISYRPKQVHQGDQWEFPGGKLEQGESAKQALCREIKEELAIDITQATPFFKTLHHYQDISVLLDIWKVESFNGEARGVESQSIQWKNIDALKAKDFPAANRIIVQRLQFSDQYLITGHFESMDMFCKKLKLSLDTSKKIVQLRYKSANNKFDYDQLVKQAVDICKKYKTQLLLNTSLEIFHQFDEVVQGLHLSSKRLFEYTTRPIHSHKILSVSCHNLKEMEQAQKIHADIILISPVKETTSHIGTKGIGWAKFLELSAELNVVTYALGGMQLSDLNKAKSVGAQGIAAISEFWNKNIE